MRGPVRMQMAISWLPAADVLSYTYAACRNILGCKAMCIAQAAVCICGTCAGYMNATFPRMGRCGMGRALICVHARGYHAWQRAYMSPRYMGIVLGARVCGMAIPCGAWQYRQYHVVHVCGAVDGGSNYVASNINNEAHVMQDSPAKQ